MSILRILTTKQMLRKPSRFQLLDCSNSPKMSSGKIAEESILTPLVKPLGQIKVQQIESDGSEEQEEFEENDAFLLPDKLTDGSAVSNTNLFTLDQLGRIGSTQGKSGPNSVRINLFQSYVFSSMNVSQEDGVAYPSNDSFSQNYFRLFMNELGYDFDE